MAAFIVLQRCMPNVYGYCILNKTKMEKFPPDTEIEMMEQETHTRTSRLTKAWIRRSLLLG